MNRDQFWTIIAESRERCDGSLDSQAQKLKELLVKFTPPEIAAFERHFDECMDRLYHWDIWAAAYIANRGCGDDNFMDFRAGLIAMGRTVFESACTNAETLVDAFEQRDASDWLSEGFVYVPTEAYDSVTDEDRPERYAAASDEPAGDRWENDAEELSRRFPRLWKYAESHDSEPQSAIDAPRGSPQAKANLKPWWKFW